MLPWIEALQTGKWTRLEPDCESMLLAWAVIKATELLWCHGEEGCRYMMPWMVRNLALKIGTALWRRRSERPRYQQLGALLFVFDMNISMSPEEWNRSWNFKELIALLLLILKL
jgi:hypothetical protein